MHFGYRRFARYNQVLPEKAYSSSARDNRKEAQGMAWAEKTLSPQHTNKCPVLSVMLAQTDIQEFFMDSRQPPVGMRSQSYGYLIVAMY